MKRQIYRVYWRHNQWHLRGPRKQFKQAGPYDHKHQAIKCARRRALLVQLFGGDLSQVVVHGKNGKIQREWSYGRDPRGTPG